ncbi:MAG TPA: hypothetical protein VK066_09930 [Chloroflexota bacterium]|nr:hypothetical protein [Chloroflexota bacterium]
MTNEPAREPSVEWEGGDPPCWAHLFEDDEWPVADRASGAADQPVEGSAAAPRIPSGGHP